MPVDDSDQTALFTFAGGPFDMSAATISFRMRPLTYGEQLLATTFTRDADGQGRGDFSHPLRESTFPEDAWVNPLAAKGFDTGLDGLTLDLEASTPGAEIIHHPAD